MDSKKKVIIVVAVVIVLIAAVFAAQALNDKRDDTATVTFLIQDNYGVYFWVDGEGKTVFDAFADAANDYNIPFEASHADYGDGIQSLFGLKMAEEDGKWPWWQQFTYADGAWTASQLTMEKLDAKDYEYVAVVYSDGSLTPAVTDVSKAAVWDKSTDGTVFTIESNSGMYFRVNGTGDTVFDAWKDAEKTYSIPVGDYTKDKSGADANVGMLFGMGTEKTAEGGWNYWSSYEYKDGAWGYASAYMNGLKSADVAQFLLVYSINGSDPVFPAAY